MLPKLRPEGSKYKQMNKCVCVCVHVYAHLCICIYIHVIPRVYCSEFVAKVNKQDLLWAIWDMPKAQPGPAAGHALAVGGATAPCSRQSHKRPQQIHSGTGSCIHDCIVRCQYYTYIHIHTSIHERYTIWLYMLVAWTLLQTVAVFHVHAT